MQIPQVSCLSFSPSLHKILEEEKTCHSSRTHGMGSTRSSIQLLLFFFFPFSSCVWKKGEKSQVWNSNFFSRSLCWPLEHWNLPTDAIIFFITLLAVKIFVTKVRARKTFCIKPHRQLKQLFFPHPEKKSPTIYWYCFRFNCLCWSRSYVILWEQEPDKIRWVQITFFSYNFPSFHLVWKWEKEEEEEETGNISMLKYLFFCSKNKREGKRRKMDGQAGQRLSSAVKRPVALHGACHKWGRMYIKVYTIRYARREKRRRWTLSSRSFQSLRWALSPYYQTTIAKALRDSFSSSSSCVLFVTCVPTYIQGRNARGVEENPSLWMTPFTSELFSQQSTPDSECVWAIPI